MRKITLFSCMLAVSMLVLLTGCSGKGNTETEKVAQEEVATIYNDGTYEGKSSDDERGAYGIVKLTIKNDKIVDAVFKGYLKNGKEKDIDYGKVIDEKTGEINQESYGKAQKALEGNAGYGPKLVEIQDINKIDVISGATHSHEQFIESVNDALSQAKK